MVSLLWLNKVKNPPSLWPSLVQLTVLTLTSKTPRNVPKNQRNSQHLGAVYSILALDNERSKFLTDNNYDVLEIPSWSSVVDNFTSGLFMKAVCIVVESLTSCCCG
ncbi:uncharacterized protein LOC123200496 [Mangifera indica]|uniref:uncharacterized protein LOC123200496 n=1 Tax=Mangifera indica TaxID=29780 RepID=UPI001CFAC193|nr:uncharacterized protein LOC123200496 [Mangifera indica]